MQTHIRFSSVWGGCPYVPAFLMLFLIALPTRAQEITFEINQQLDELTFTSDLVIANDKLFASGDVLLRYGFDADAKATFEGVIPYNGTPVELTATDAFLFVGDFASTVTLFDLSDPDNLVERGVANTAGATLDMVAQDNLLITTPDIFSSNVVEFFDVTDPDNPAKVGQYTPGAFAAGLFLSDSGTELFIATEQKLEIVDVTNPANPVLLGSVDLAGRGQVVTVIGTNAFVGSQMQENVQTAETPGWFLEAFDISDLSNPQFLAETSATDGPIQGLIRLEAGFLLGSFQTGLQAFAFEASTAAFKVMDEISGVGKLDGIAAGSVIIIDTETLPPNCLQVFTTSEQTIFFYGMTGLSGDAGITGVLLKLPPPGGEPPILETMLSPVENIDCPPKIGDLITAATGTLQANLIDAWKINQLNFKLIPPGDSLRIQDLAFPLILEAFGQTFQAFAGNLSVDAGMRVTEIRFSLEGVVLTAGATEEFEVFMAFDYQLNNTSIAPCTNMNRTGPRRIFFDLKLHPITDVDAEPASGGDGVQLPNQVQTGGRKELACVLNITPEPDLGFTKIQNGVSNANPNDEVGVCPGTYVEAVDVKITGLRLFSFEGPDTTTVRAPNPSLDVMTITKNRVRIEGFFITKGKNGVVVVSGVEDAVVGGSATKAFNVIVNQKENGVLIFGTKTEVLNNLIGVDLDGKTPLKNGANGVLIRGARDPAMTNGSHNLIMNNVISGNDSSGVAILSGIPIFTLGPPLPARLLSGSGIRNRILGNKIGVDATGALAVPNGAHGVFIGGGGSNLVGAMPFGGVIHNLVNASFTPFCRFTCNLISGNRRHGVFVLDGLKDDISGNFIGTDRLGNVKIANRGDGVRLKRGLQVSVGFLRFQDGNLINGNAGNGVAIKGGAMHFVRGNVIGTATNFVLMPNGKDGINSVKSFDPTIDFNDIRGHESSCLFNCQAGIRFVSQGLPATPPCTGGGNISFNSIHQNQDGVVITSSCGVSILANTITFNLLGIFDFGSFVTLSANTVEDNLLPFTGIHIESGEADIQFNNIRNNNGLGINVGEEATVVVRHNNITGNEIGLRNANPAAVVDGRENFWGGAGGPSGVGGGTDDAVNGGVMVFPFLSEPISVVAGVLVDTVFIPVGVTDSVFVFFNNLLDPTDVLNVTVADEAGWLQTGPSFTITLADSVWADTTLQFVVPAGEAEGTQNRVILTTTSQRDPAAVAVDTFVVTTFVPVLTRLTVAPDSIIVLQGTTLRFTAQGFDQFEGDRGFTPTWSASGGTIDAEGSFTVGTMDEEVIVTATDEATGLQAQARVRVTEAFPDPARIVVEPDTVFLTPGNPEVFTALGFDEAGFAVDFTPVWEATAGQIAQDGFFTAEDVTETVLVTATDAAGGVQGQAVVLIEDPTTVGVEDEVEIPGSFALHQNYPNPFNPTTVIRYDLPVASRVTMDIFNLLGQRVARLVEASLHAGQHQVVYSAERLASGVYFIRLIATPIAARQPFVSVKKMVFVR